MVGHIVFLSEFISSWASYHEFWYMDNQLAVMWNALEILLKDNRYAKQKGCSEFLQIPCSVNIYIYMCVCVYIYLCIIRVEIVIHI